ncbi:hypothetical protein ACFXC9_30115, partial [Streptomyces naganishii]|uniref:hypothetical protein n=1 Tax=Streptomyces naganishii TaxID=285447 RepID=UPI00369AD16A
GPSAIAPQTLTCARPPPPPPRAARAPPPPPPAAIFPKEFLTVALTVSLVVFAGIVVLILIRTGYLRIWPALAAALFGFTLASTGIAPAITSGISSIAGMLSSLG